MPRRLKCLRSLVLQLCLVRLAVTLARTISRIRSVKCNLPKEWVCVQEFNACLGRGPIASPAHDRLPRLISFFLLRHHLLPSSPLLPLYFQESQVSWPPQRSDNHNDHEGKGKLIALRFRMYKGSAAEHPSPVYLEPVVRLSRVFVVRVCGG